MKRQDKLPDLASLACVMGGPGPAIEFAEFAESLHGLSDARRGLLLYAWMATKELPRDADFELATLRRVIVDLRDEWMGQKN